MLTEREKEILLYMNLVDIREISKRLYIEISTVKTHTANIYQKLHVHNRVQAVIKALKLGIIQLQELKD